MKKRLRGFEVCKQYQNTDVNLPKRSTERSAGYDVEVVEDIVIKSLWKSVLKKRIPKPTLVNTGVKAFMQEDEVVLLFNRSSNPMKRGLVLANGVGVVDADYYGSPDNDGHIMFAYYNFFPWDCVLQKGDKIGQAMFQKFLKADNDEATEQRTGGYGSTGI